jgi:hypothetical protein
VGLIDLPDLLVDLRLFLGYADGDLNRDGYEVMPVVPVRLLLASFSVSLDYKAVLDAGADRHCFLSPDGVVFQLGAEDSFDDADFDGLIGVKADLLEATPLRFSFTALYPYFDEEVAKVASLVVLVAPPLHYQLLVIANSRPDVHGLLALLRQLTLPAASAALRPTHCPAPPAAPAETDLVLGDVDAASIALLALDLPTRRISVAARAGHFLPDLQTLCSPHLTFSVPVLTYSKDSSTSAMISSFLLRVFCFLEYYKSSLDYSSSNYY